MISVPAPMWRPKAANPAHSENMLAPQNTSMPRKAPEQRIGLESRTQM
jgi:hypothetical protein